MTFVPLAKRHDLREGVVRRLRHGGLDLLLVQWEQGLHVVENRCPHDGSPLHKGVVAAGCIRCPRHGILFHLASGKAQGGDAVADLAPLRQFPIQWCDDTLGVHIPD